MYRIHRISQISTSSRERITARSDRSFAQLIIYRSLQYMLLSRRQADSYFSLIGFRYSFTPAHGGRATFWEIPHILQDVTKEWRCSPFRRNASKFGLPFSSFLFTTRSRVILVTGLDFRVNRRMTSRDPPFPPFRPFSFRSFVI